MSIALEFQNIGKRFPGVKALEGVSFRAEAGSVHALMGENGAGKSTLLKILSGVYSLEEGAVLMDGQPVRFRTPIEAINAGVAVIYQELNLAPDMTVEENLLLGQMPNTAGWLDKKKMRSEARRALAMLEEDIHPGTRLGSLPIAQRQMVEIAKALLRNARVIAFDEPTSSLTERETRKLFSVIGDLKKSGKAILYVSHRMQEIFEVCDAITVLRDGRLVESFPDIAAVTPDLLVSKMVGRSIEDIFHYAPRAHGGPALELTNIEGPGLTAPISLNVAKGEIVGFFGLVGAGRTELLRLIFGAERRVGGTIKVCGNDVNVQAPLDAIRAGIMLCPEDRKKEGIVPIRSVGENLSLSIRRTFASMGFINDRRERENALAYVERLKIKTPSLNQLIQNLSGGNQQKVILARWLSENVKVMLLDEPTRGIDVGAKSEIFAIIQDLANQGIGVVVVSSDLPEVLGVSDRIIVMRQGRVAAELMRADATEEIVVRHALPLAEATATPA